VEVTEDLPRRRIHRAPPGEDRERLGESVVAIREVREEEPHTFEALAPEPALLEREERALRSRDLGIYMLPVRARLLDAEGEPKDARMNLGRLGGELGSARLACRRDAHDLHPHPSSL
jgi:hypothetical protein